MSKIKNVNAHSVYTFDFSTLYTNLPIIDIHDKLTKLIKKMYQNANAHTTFLLIHTQVKHFGLTQIKVATNHSTCNIYWMLWNSF